MKLTIRDNFTTQLIMKKIILILTVVLLSMLSVSSCGSPKSKECQVCGTELDDTAVKATNSDGENIVLCPKCYRRGKYLGVCL